MSGDSTVGGAHSAGMRDFSGTRQPGAPRPDQCDRLDGVADDWPAFEEPERRFWVVGRAELLAGLVCAVAMAAAGLPLGLLWAATAPGLNVRAVLAGSEVAFDAQAGVDVYFAMICAVGGLAGGVLGFWRGRDGGWPVPAGLALGGIGGSLLASWIGHVLRSARAVSQLPEGTGSLVVQLVEFRLRSPGFLLVLPAASLFVLSVLNWLSLFLMPRRE
ncbi:hypothetical protein [Protofrankia symbiont of Coriaria ruscifolia]|uniref:DUF2567 domain-containing protein n=1 Tax=Candidatus Protofrankia californiensis TaxID=1839754 RepID=A0A1C3P720_9ACTN|nr:hypothetical protein [Protofrankia symbiont of Coriaria ruscifolia]SBW25635.1 hypothetical protein FDG2_4629 [Candidatus Protofrankia californiensis]